jgi:hypothetical protein
MRSAMSLKAEIDARLSRIERAIVGQKMFVHRLPDPDTRERADGHLIELIEKRDRLLGAMLGKFGAR